MLDAFVGVRTPKGLMAVSVRLGARNNRAEHWVGRSHESDVPGMVSYRLSWIRSLCRDRDLEVTPFGEVINGQTWLLVQ